MTSLIDARTQYQEAQSPLAMAARAKFEGMIHDGKACARSFFERLGVEAPVDFVVPTNKLDFILENNRVKLTVDGSDSHEWFLHRHALIQMVTKTDILTGKVADKMFLANSQISPEEVDRWGADLLLHNLRTIYGNSERARVLVRVVQTHQQAASGVPGEIRGFLSDRYGRWDSGPILGAFAEKAAEFGAVPLVTDNRYNAIFQTDIRLGFSMFLPVVFEPVEGEVILLGITVRTSDYGAGSFTVSLMIMRIKCTNMQVMRNELKKVHLGRRLSDDIEFSQETYASDTRTMALATRDMVGNLFRPERINQQIETIRLAATEKIDATAVHDRLQQKGHLLLKEKRRVNELFNSADVEMLPPGNTLWRSSQSVALFANELEGEGEVTRAVQLRAVSGMMMDKFEEKLKKAS